jgi:hypothetical protein
MRWSRDLEAVQFANTHRLHEATHARSRW